jgi:hypothetical protein
MKGMKRLLLGIALGAAAGVIGVIVYELTDVQIIGWLTAAILLGCASQLTPPATGRWPSWGGLGGGIILLCAVLNIVIPYPSWIAWPLLGAVFGCLAPLSGVRWRIEGGAIGLLAGSLGMGIVILITQIFLPLLNLPPFFDYEFDEVGMIVAGAAIGGTTVWLRGKGGKKFSKNKKRGVSTRGKKKR